MIRASMNLTLASCLIALGTSFELPLSTTYVTFMVSMGTSLADRAWGRESAVYRIAGVFTVIGGWFLTAFIALSVSMIFAFIIDWGGIIAVVLLFLFSIYVLYRTFAHHRKTEIANSLRKEEDGDILGICNQHTRRILNYIPELLKDTVEAIYTGDRKNIKQLQMKINLLLLDTKNRKNHFTVNLRNLEEDSLECGQFYLQMLHYIREFSHSTEYFVNAAHEHIMNNHRCIIEEQYEELCVLHKGVEQIFSSVAGAIDTQDFKEKEKIKRSQEKMLDLISSYQINQVRRVKNGQTNTRNTMLYMTLLYGIRDILVHLVRLLKVQSKYYR